MFYFFILSNFKSVIIGHTWQEVARRIPLNLIEYRAYAENNCAEMILNKQRYYLRGYRFLSNNMNKEVMEKRKSWGPQMFSVKNIGSRLETNKKLLGGYNILLKFVFSDNPHANYQRYAHWGLHYKFMITL